jgi:glycosyltransferase involved in cell wall biosynthesis
MALALVWTALRARPDVLYAFKPIGYAGLAALAGWALRQAGRRRPVIAVDADDWEGTGGWAERDHASALRTRLIDWQERWGLSQADVLTVASRELERLVASTRARIVYVPNAASPSSPGWTRGDRRALRESLGIGDAPVVLAYTRFVEFSPLRLAEAAAKTLERVPDAHLVVAGQGLAGEERVFTRLIAERGMSARAHLLGWTTVADLPNVFATADVALYPLDDTLLNRAKCPMKLVDLLLAGVPVVADAVGQAREYVRDGITGALVHPGDVDAMVHQSIDLIRDPRRRQAIGAHAREDMLANWTWAQQVEAIDLALREVTTQLSGAGRDGGRP